MPAGFYSAGTGFSGADPVAAFSLPPKVLRTTNAALWDLSTKTVLRDEATGLIKRIHWVDQAVALALGVQLGSVPSDPGLGHRLREIKRSSEAKLKTACIDAVNQALSALIERNDIAVFAIAVNASVRSQIAVAVSYANLHTNPSRNKQNAEKLSVAF
jgi:hypothetical protein